MHLDDLKWNRFVVSVSVIPEGPSTQRLKLLALKLMCHITNRYLRSRTSNIFILTWALCLFWHRKLFDSLTREAAGHQPANPCRRLSLAQASRRNGCFHKLGVRFVDVLIQELYYLGSILGPLIFGKYHMSPRSEPRKPYVAYRKSALTFLTPRRGSQKIGAFFESPCNKAQSVLLGSVLGPPCMDIQIHRYRRCCPRRRLRSVGRQQSASQVPNFESSSDVACCFPRQVWTVDDRNSA